MSTNSSFISNETDLSCFEVYSEPKYTGLLVLNSVLSVVSCLFLLSMMSIIVLFKKYVFFNQRLILYLGITSFLFSLFSAINLSSPFAHKNTQARNYCTAMGYFDHLFLWCQVMSVACIMIDVFIKVVWERNTERYETIYLLLTIGLPLLQSFVPIFHLAYGHAGVFCWIRDREYDDCSIFYFGLYLRFILFYVPFYLLMFVIAILLLISLYFTRRKRRQWTTGKSNKQIIVIQKKLESEIRPLVAYPAVFVCLTIIPLIQRIYGIFNTEGNVYYALSIVLVLVYRLLGVIITVIFTFDPETRKKLKWIEICAAIKRWCGQEKDVVIAYNVEKGHTDSFISSTPYKALSEEEFVTD